MIFDHIIYWIGRLGGQKLVHRVCAKRPKWAQMFEQSREQIQKRGALAVIVGRYLPFIGRWMGLGAGLAGVPFTKFAIYDAIGAALSAFGFGLVAHFVGRKTIEHPYFYQVLVGCIAGATLLAVAGVAVGWWRNRNAVEME
jgi:membrane-associated protein